MTIKHQTIDIINHGPYSEMILKDGTFFTPDRIYEMGMMACNVCGTLMPIEKKYCPQCREWVVCIREKYLGSLTVEKEDAKIKKQKQLAQSGSKKYLITPSPNTYEKLDNYIARFMRHDCMQVRYPVAQDRYDRAIYLYSHLKPRPRKK